MWHCDICHSEASDEKTSLLISLKQPLMKFENLISRKYTSIAITFYSYWVRLKLLLLWADILCIFCQLFLIFLSCPLSLLSPPLSNFFPQFSPYFIPYFIFCPLRECPQMPPQRAKKHTHHTNFKICRLWLTTLCVSRSVICAEN